MTSVLLLSFIKAMWPAFGIYGN
uniref:Uncharacterized protein n=1 Tax=Rhizophora mucronata TaxID=61149 RepID=A0A2P2PZ35_RHIMU